MADKRIDRRLAAVMAADVSGFSRMMARDEARTLADLIALRRQIFGPRVAEHRGRVVKLMGDGALVEFASVVDAVNAAVAIQSALAEANAAAPEDRRIWLRIGVNLGDVIIEGTDIYGDGVNVAARLQEVAEPGEVVLSATAHEHAASRIGATFADAGQRSLKNIPAPVRIFRWSSGSGSGAGTAGATDAPPLPDKPSIAVLPFDNLSGDPEQEHVADGVVEFDHRDAVADPQLLRHRPQLGLRLTRASAKNVREIGRELGVAYLLEGSVQRAGGRIRITVQLIETAGGAHIWAEKYDGALDDVFELQDRITEQVAGALQPSIRLAEIERARRKRPQELGAYDYTMRALPHVWTLERAQADRALALLEKALEIDADYPLALALAGWCWAQRSVYNWVEDIDSAKARALSLAERAAAISNDDPLILTVLGTVHTFARNFGTARVLLERAIALDPNAAWALSRLGWLEVYAGRAANALPYFERALRLSPLDPMNFNNHAGIGSAHDVAGNYDAAANEYLRALDERPNALWIHRNLAPALLAAGRVDEAMRSREALMAAFPGLTIARFKEAMVFDAVTLDRIAAGLRELGVPEE